MPLKRVHLTVGDGCGWAIDEDLRLLRASLAGVAELTSIDRAEAVHAVWWIKLLRCAREDFRGRHVLCYADNAPFHYLTEPEFLQARELVTLWIGRSREAVAQFSALGIESRFAPYTFDAETFRPLPAEHPGLQALARKWRIPTDQYLIANFHRDTEGSDLRSPKLQKGPDAFLEIVARLHERGRGIHVLLAGPRRFWLRRELAARGVPFTFIGAEGDGSDDYAVNVLPRAELNLLYNLADLHLIASRWEGGPHSVLESAATRCKIISTRVGIAPDVLAPECLFDDVIEACALIERDLADGFLEPSRAAHEACVHAHHTAPALRRALVEIYSSLEPLPAAPAAPAGRWPRLLRGAAERVLGRFRRSPAPPSLAILHRAAEHDDPAFARFLDRLTAELASRGCAVLRNSLEPAPDAILFGQLPPGDPLWAGLRGRGKIPVVGLCDEFRVTTSEGLRETRAPAGGTPALPGDCAAERREFHDCTLLPSFEALASLRARGEEPRRPLIFTPPLDGPVPEDVLVVEAGDAAAAGIIQAAFARRIPVLYPASAQYGFMVWFGGLAYAGAAEIPQKLDTLRAHYAMFQRLIAPATLSSFTDRLLRLVKTLPKLLSDDPTA